MFGTGPLSVMGGVEGLAWIPTKFANRSEDFPDIELHYLSGTPGSDGGRQIRKVHGLSDKLWEVGLAEHVWHLISAPHLKSLISGVPSPGLQGYVRHRAHVTPSQESRKCSTPDNEPVCQAARQCGILLWPRGFGSPGWGCQVCARHGRDGCVPTSGYQVLG